MAWLTRDQKLEIARLHGADYHTNVDASRFPLRALLDMRFQPGKTIRAGTELMGRPDRCHAARVRR